MEVLSQVEVLVTPSTNFCAILATRCNISIKALALCGISPAVSPSILNNNDINRVSNDFPLGSMAHTLKIGKIVESRLAKFALSCPLFENPTEITRLQVSKVIKPLLPTYKCKHITLLPFNYDRDLDSLFLSLYLESSNKLHPEVEFDIYYV